jgi:outer membrane protein OmpA-like peptidoglycan-associated protein
MKFSFWQQLSCYISYIFAIQSLSAQSDSLRNVKITNEFTINTNQLEYSPAFYEDGVVFISTKDAGGQYSAFDERIGTNTMSIFIGRRDDLGKLKTPEPFAKELLSYLHEGPVTFDRTNETIYFTQNNVKKGKVITGRDGISKLKIYAATKINGIWSDIKELPFNGNEFNTCHPTINADGNKMYFSSDRPGGKGGMDIWVSFKNGDAWTKPINLGSDVNTSKNELFPFVHADGTVFYASNGLGGLGGLDIFYTALVNKKWLKANALNAPFNSTGDDLGVIIDSEKKNGYFSSNRGGGAGGDDIYAFNINGITGDGFFDRKTKFNTPSATNTEEFVLSVRDSLTRKSLKGALLAYIDIEELKASNPILNKDGSLSVVTIGNNADFILRTYSNNKGTPIETNDDGMLKLTLHPGKYLLKIAKEGYVPRQLIADLSKNNTLLIRMEKMENKVALRGTAMNKAYNTPIPGAEIRIKDEASKEILYVTTDEKGNYECFVNPNRNYSYTVTKNDKVSPEKLFNTNNGAAPKLDLHVPDLPVPLIEGAVIRLANIYYNFNDATLRPDARQDLDALVQLLKTYPEMDIEIGSHTDSRGDSIYNANLSQRRAESVVLYLQAKGVPTKQLTAKGYGESALRNNCKDGTTCTEPEHQVNRRVEFKILHIPIKVAIPTTTPTPINITTTVTPVSPAEKQIDNFKPATEVKPNDENGFYYVIAGTFKNKENATLQVERVKNMGYSGAFIMSHPDLPYQAVCVAKYKDGAVATALANKLKVQLKVDSFVKKL